MAHQQGIILQVHFRGADYAGYDLIPTHVDGDGTVRLDEAILLLRTLTAESHVESIDSPGTVTTIARAAYYLQLGAYTNESQARDRASNIPAEYPVSIVGPGSQPGNVYRILVGPLNRAESGTLLYWFRARGFPDAFIKQPE